MQNDPGLNGDWYWVSLLKEREDIKRAFLGHAEILNIQNPTLCQDNPCNFLKGETTKCDSEEVPNNHFYATHITTTRNSDLIYEWTYDDGLISSGVTQVSFKSNNNKLMSRLPKKIHVISNDKAMIDTYHISPYLGVGEIFIYREHSEAEKLYNEYSKNNH